MSYGAVDLTRSSMHIGSRTRESRQRLQEIFLALGSGNSGFASQGHNGAKMSPTPEDRTNAAHKKPRTTLQMTFVIPYS
jgi:hypothetical protein